MLVTDMYIVGFLLIFAGLSLFLYYFVQRFADRTRPHSAGLEPIVQAETIRFSGGSVSVPQTEPTPILTEAPPSVVVPASETTTTVHPAVNPPTPESRPPARDQAPAPDLFIAGYLYVDPKRATAAYLDRPQLSPPDSTAEMNRIGPATLRSWNGAFQFDHGTGVIVMPESRLKEIRFTPGGAVFVPATSDLPIVYYFTVEAQAIREFLSQRSR